MPSTLPATIRLGALGIRFVLDAETSEGRATAFECDVPANAVMAAAHSHDGFDETNYGLTGVTTFTVDGQRRELHPGEVVFIPRGAVHAFTNRGAEDAPSLAIGPRGLPAPHSSPESGARPSAPADGPPDLAAI